MKIKKEKLLEFLYYGYVFFLLALNLLRVFDNNYWADECYSIGLTKLSFLDMIKETASDVHPPLYYYYLTIIAKLFNYKYYSYHFASFLIYVISVFFVITKIKRTFGVFSSLLLATFLSVSSNAVIYNVEVRMYSLALLFIMLSYFEFYNVINRGNKKDYFLFIVFSLAAAYTHYYALLAVAFFYIGLLVMVIQKRKTFKELLLTYLITIACYLPWVINALTSFFRTTSSFWMTYIPSYINSLWYFFSLDIKWFGIIMFVLTVLNILYIILVTKNVIKDNNDIINSDFKAWLIWGFIAAIGTLTIGELVSILINPCFDRRYMYPVSVTIWMIISVTIPNTKYSNIICPIVITLSLFTYLPNYANIFISEYSQNNICNSTVGVIKDNVDKNDILVTNNSHLNWTILNYYFKNDNVMVDTIESISKNNTILVWQEQLSENEIEALRKNNLEAKEILVDGILGCNYVNVYRVETIENDKEISK